MVEFSRFLGVINFKAVEGDYEARIAEPAGESAAEGEVFVGAV